MARRSSQRRRVKKRGPTKGLVGLALVLAAVFAVAWFLSRDRDRPSVDDQVMELIRENPSAEVLAPGPGGPSEKGVPEVFQPDGAKRSSREDRSGR